MNAFLSNHPVGAYYNPTLKQWGVLNEDGSSMPIGAHFNIMIGSKASNGGSEFVTKAKSGNSAGSSNESGNPLSSDNAFNDEPVAGSPTTHPSELPSKKSGTTPAAPSASHAFGRRPAVATTPKSQRSLASPDASAATQTESPATTTTATGSTPPVTTTPLHVDIVSGVADEVVSIYVGDELLLTTPLQAAHIGDTLRFDCPISPGEHAFRVVLSRADETVLVEKSSTSLIRAEGSNFLGVHVTRRAKMLVKHESSLEVVWPSTTAPIATAVSARAESGTALR